MYFAISAFFFTHNNFSVILKAGVDFVARVFMLKLFWIVLKSYSVCFKYFTCI